MLWNGKAFVCLVLDDLGYTGLGVTVGGAELFCCIWCFKYNFGG